VGLSSRIELWRFVSRLSATRGAALALALALLATTAAAQDESPVSERSWRFSVEPYFFIPLYVGAQVTIAGRTASLNLGLGDILNLDAAFDGGLRFEAWKGGKGWRSTPSAWGSPPGGQCRSR